MAEWVYVWVIGQIKLYVVDGIDGCVDDLLGGRIDKFGGC